MSLAVRSRAGWRRSWPLALSVALNVFLAALLMAQWLRPALAPGGSSPTNSPIGRIVDALPGAEAGRMRAVLDHAQPQRQAARDRVSAAQRDVAAAIARVPYDEGDVRRALVAWQTSWHDFSTQFNTVLLDGLRTLSDNGRARFAEAALAEDARRRHAP